MKSFILSLAVLTSVSSFADSLILESEIIKSHEKIKDDTTFRYELALDNKNILEATCFETKRIGPTTYRSDGTWFEKTAEIEARLGDGRAETGRLTSRMLVTVQRDSAKGEEFCNQSGICSDLATVTFPIWVIPVMIGTSIRDLSRTSKNGKFLKTFIKDLGIPDCSEMLFKP